MRLLKPILFALALAAVFLIASGFTCDILCLRLVAQSNTDPQAKMTARQVDALISELQSDNYQTRQEASRLLARGGPSIIRQLVEQVVGGPPESATRCAQILSQIAIESEQSEMARIARIMLLLSDHGFQHLRNDSLMLNHRWKQNQLERTLGKIRESGIQVDAIPAAQAFHGFAVVEDPFGEIEIQAGNAPTPEQRPPDVVQSPALSENELLAEVERIANATGAENEKAFAEQILARSGQTPMGMPDRDEMVEASAGVVIGGGGELVRIMPDGRLVHQGVPANGAQSVFNVSIDASFSGTGEELALLNLLPAISQFAINDRDLDKEFLEALKNGPQVGYITLQNCRYELADIFDFMNARPQTQISAAGHDAFLGVRVVNAGVVDGVYECVIESIVPETAAEKEGCLAGDIIESIDGFPIRSYNQLIVAIGSFQPGDEATFDFRREDNSYQKKITFLSRPPGQ